MELASPPSSLNEVQERLVEDMKRDGIAVVSFDELVDDERLWDELQADIDVFVRETEPRLPELRARDDRKAYIVNRFKTSTRFRLDDLPLRLGLSDHVLDVVNAYRGELTKLVALNHWYTIPDSSTEARVASQEWHRDPWDNHVVKVFTYFSDVDESAGPFEYVRGSPAGGRYGHLWPWLDAVEKGIYPPQKELAAAVALEDIYTVTGAAATMIFCDTSGFHRGGWARARPRVLSYHAYVSPRANANQRFRVDVDSNGGHLTPAARFAIAAPPKAA
jgi:hypothetical protein